MDQLQKEIENLTLSKTGFVYSEETLKHKDPKDKHVERPARVSSIISEINQLITNKSGVEIVHQVEPWYLSPMIFLVLKN